MSISKNARARLELLVMDNNPKLHHLDKEALSEVIAFLNDGTTHEDRELLEKNEYVPIVYWRRHNVLCSTGEALKNIEVAEKQKKCIHRKGSFDSCLYCGKILPVGRY